MSLKEPLSHPFYALLEKPEIVTLFITYPHRFFI